MNYIVLSLYHWEFCLTLNVIARILREVVNRVKLGDHHAQRRSRGEVQSRVVVRRRGKVETRMSLRPPSTLAIVLSFYHWEFRLNLKILAQQLHLQEVRARVELVSIVRSSHREVFVLHRPRASR